MATLALVATGCGPGGPQLYKAGGTLTNNKVPVEGAQVTFAYDDGDFANGFTDAAGKFELTYKNNAGKARSGICNVSVSKKAGASSGTSTTNYKEAPKSPDEHKARQEEQQRIMQGFAKKQADLDATGGASGDISKYGLVLEIKADAKGNDFAIDILDFKN